LLSLNFGALRRLPRDICHHEADFGLAGTDELQVVDGTAGHLRGRLQSGDVLGQHVGHAAPAGNDAAGTAGRDRDPVLLLRRGGHRDRQRNGRGKPRD
jgi:hypothetical protein